MPRRLGAVVCVSGVVGYLLVTRVLLPHFAGGTAFMYWSYDTLGKDLPSALGFMVRHPLKTVQLFFTPAVKWHTMLWIFAPYGFLTLGSSTMILLVPLLAERFFSSGPQYWVTGYHYTATASPIVAMGAAEGLQRLLPLLRKHSERRRARWLPRAVAVAGVALVAYFPLHELFLSRLWQTGGRVAAAHAAVAVVPRGVTVEATDRLQPHLVDHTDALLLDGEEHDATLAGRRRRQVGLAAVERREAAGVRRPAQGRGLAAGLRPRRLRRPPRPLAVLVDPDIHNVVPYGGELGQRVGSALAVLRAGEDERRADEADEDHRRRRC